MASLQELLADEGFESSKKTPARTHRKVKFKDREDSNNIALPIYICHDRRSSLDFSKTKSRRPFSSTTSSVHSSQKSNVKSTHTHVEGNIPRRDEPAIDEIAIRAVISILSGFVGQYSRDKDFREAIKEKCYACFARKKSYSDDGIFADIELAIESIERLVDSIDDTKREVKVKSLQYSIRLLTIVASLNSNNSGNASTCGIPNSNLSACAQLYLSIVYKLEKNDRIAARHLLQVFVDSPYLARTHLLPELWEHLFLPHLLHLKIWHTQELEVLSSLEYAEKEKHMKALNKLYNDHVDIGTTKFALYYKQWLKVGAQAPAVPSVPLPSKVGYSTSRRRSMDSVTSNSSVKNNSLYRAVFGPITERKSMDAARNGIWDYEEEEKEKISSIGDDLKQGNYSPKKTVVHRRSSSQSNRTPKHDQWDHTHKKSDRFPYFSCQSEPVECLREGNSKIGSVSIRKEEEIIPSVSNDLSRAIFAICSSDSLSECELAIRLVAKSWLDSHGDPETVKRLSTAPVIEGIMNVLFASEDDEILELAISILAELVTRKETNGQIILNSDSQLNIFLRLLRSSSLFLKAAILLYLVQPKAKQMISIEWIPLVLRVLEFADQLQTLFTVQRSPQEAAYYLLDQLLTGFDEDKNFENCRQVISLGGLSLLLRRVETGNVSEKSKVASVMYYCVQSDGSCRHYLAKNLKKGCLLPLLLLQNQHNTRGHVFAFLTELLCIDKQIQRIEFLRGLLSGWGMVNTLHTLLLYLQRAQQEERPIISAILLQLDLLGDPNECSVYREEVIEEIIKALDCQVFNEKVQVQSARALLILGSCFSYAGEPVVEQCLLKEAGYDENAGDSYLGKNFILNSFTNLFQNEEEEATRNWQRKTAIVLLNSGNKRLLSGLVDSIANGIPCLGRASLVTVTWMSNFFCFIEDKGVQSLVYSELIPELIKLLKYNNAIEERVLASLSLLKLANNSDYLAKLSPLDKELINDLHKLSEVTWTAKELVSIISSSSRHHQQLNVP
ncbi:putative E3 ubiquitin-protein ligase LIN isoform X1 [Solanum stenotomum]|uniref:putative E3 ubiquitin-protein ligase LIN isoform X1 n=1 Tax=Solanum stenotomum TaxID=172797 RepID=UPI0020D0ABA1|nr:putative E3 ubiquitin-protein ligase LIN isoform X1 [Solanum stenotomum]